MRREWISKDPTTRLKSKLDHETFVVNGMRYNAGQEGRRGRWAAFGRREEGGIE
jgi:hypothetical protein